MVRLKANALVNGSQKSLQILVDTGSDHSMIPQSLAKRLGLRWHLSNNPSDCETSDGRIRFVKNEANVDIRIPSLQGRNNTSYRATVAVYIMPGTGNEMLLGSDWLCDNWGQVDSRARTVTVKDSKGNEHVFGEGNRGVQVQSRDNGGGNGGNVNGNNSNGDNRKGGNVNGSNVNPSDNNRGSNNQNDASQNNSNRNDVNEVDGLAQRFRLVALGLRGHGFT